MHTKQTMKKKKKERDNSVQVKSRKNPTGEITCLNFSGVKL